MHDFLSHNAVIRRAVHITENSSGDLYISDDLACRIYRIIYNN